jgi:hypothetical protein
MKGLVVKTAMIVALPMGLAFAAGLASPCKRVSPNVLARLTCEPEVESIVEDEKASIIR